MENKEERIQRIDDEILKLKEKKNKIYFLVLDTKGNPSGSLQYIYRMALALKDNGHDVEMLHQEKEFVGPKDWLGEQFGELTHRNITEENVEVSPSDILVIPEIFCNILDKLSEVPCQKVVLFQNFEMFTEFMPFSATFAQYGIKDAIATSESEKECIMRCFPYMTVHVIEPGISSMFRHQEEPQKLVINIVSRDQYDINKIIKPFYWKYPVYKWVSFRDLRGMNQETFADSLRDGAITIWLDDPTNFGYSAIEAMKSGSILMAKIPSNPSDWMLNEKGELIENVLWFTSTRTVSDMLASLVRSWTLDLIPEEIYTGLEIFDDRFKLDTFKENAEKLFTDVFMKERASEFEEAKKYFEANKEEKNDQE